MALVYKFKDSKTIDFFVDSPTDNQTYLVNLLQKTCNGTYLQVTTEPKPVYYGAVASFTDLEDGIYIINEETEVRKGLISIEHFLYLYSEYVCDCNGNDVFYDIDAKTLAEMVVVANNIFSIYNIKMRVDSCLIGKGMCLNNEDYLEKMAKILSFWAKIFYDIYENALGEEKASLFLDKKQFECCLSDILNMTMDEIGVNSGEVIININNPNNPPSNVDDSFFNINTFSQKILDSSYFTTNYVDPEGDPPYKVKILSLPTKGALLYNGMPVHIGQEIPVQDLDNGLLVYYSMGIEGSDSFRFTISDQGSQQYL